MRYLPNLQFSGVHVRRARQLALSRFIYLVTVIRRTSSIFSDVKRTKYIPDAGCDRAKTCLPRATFPLRYISSLPLILKSVRL